MKTIEMIEGVPCVRTIITYEDPRASRSMVARMINIVEFYNEEIQSFSSFYWDEDPEKAFDKAREIMSEEIVKMRNPAR